MASNVGGWFHFAILDLCPPCLTSFKSESLHCLCISVLHGNQLRDMPNVLLEIKVSVRACFAVY